MLQVTMMWRIRSGNYAILYVSLDNFTTCLKSNISTLSRDTGSLLSYIPWHFFLKSVTLVRICHIIRDISSEIHSSRSILSYNPWHIIPNRWHIAELKFIVYVTCNYLSVGAIYQMYCVTVHKWESHKNIVNSRWLTMICQHIN